MVTTKEEKRQPDQKKQEKGLLEAVIRDNVLTELGQPDGIVRVQVTCVWGNRYRANVFVGANLTSLKVAHSYFLEADGNGKILSSSPALKQVY